MADVYMRKKIVIVIIMCSKLMFLQRFKYTDHYCIANTGALVGVHVNRQKNHRHRIGYMYVT